MSLRQQAKILGIAPSYLSMMLSGKRPWKPEIKERYEQLVNTTHFVGGGGGYMPVPSAGTMVELERIELSTSSMPLKRSPK
jgi:hypothetical protein